MTPGFILFIHLKTTMNRDKGTKLRYQIMWIAFYKNKQDSEKNSLTQVEYYVYFIIKKEEEEEEKKEEEEEFILGV